MDRHEFKDYKKMSYYDTKGYRKGYVEVNDDTSDRDFVILLLTLGTMVIVLAIFAWDYFMSLPSTEIPGF